MVQFISCVKIEVGKAVNAKETSVVALVVISISVQETSASKCAHLVQQLT